jgi:hypothetical protein
MRGDLCELTSARPAGLHGHKCAIDAVLSATALTAPGPVSVLTSDPEDIAALWCDGGRSGVPQGVDLCCLFRALA